MLRRQKHVILQSTTPFACTLPVPKTGTRVHSDDPLYQTWAEGGFGSSCSPVTKNRDEGTFAKTAFCSSQDILERISSKTKGPDIAPKSFS